MKKEILEWVVAIAVAIALIALITKFVGKSYSIKGDSMDPTLKDGERVVVNIIGYKLGGVEKGNVIVFHANKKDDYVKRVIGTPGDSVEKIHAFLAPECTHPRFHRSIETTWPLTRLKRRKAR